MTTNEAITNSSSNTFNEHQRHMLRSFSKLQTNGKDYSATPNKTLEDYIQTLRDIYPEKFHRTKNDLDTRVFFDAPTTFIPHARSVRPRSNSPYLTKDAK
jgi:hypothetical protein